MCSLTNLLSHLLTFKLFVITNLLGKIKIKLLFRGPKWLSKPKQGGWGRHLFSLRKVKEKSVFFVAGIRPSKVG